MALKETIACIGPGNGIFPTLIQKLANANYRLLLVSDKEQPLLSYSKNIQSALPAEKIEIIACPKEGCWEADLILLAEEVAADREIMNKIKEVSTQKMVACLSLYHNATLPAGTIIHDLQQSLPHARIIQLLVDTSCAEASLSGKDTETLTIIESILKQSGFRMRQPA